MEDSDDEIFWGPVTVRELKIISEQLAPTDRPKEKEIVSLSDSDSSLEEGNPNDILNNVSRSEISPDRDSAERFERNEHNLQIDEDSLSTITSSSVPKTVITCYSSPEQSSPVIATHESDVMTYNGNCSVIGDSLINGKDPLLQISGESFQSPVNDCELLECDLPNSEAYAFKYVNVSEPEEACETSNNDTVEQLSNMSNEIIIEYESLNFNVSTGGTCDSTKSNLSSLQKTCETFENNSDSCKSVFANSVSLHTVPNDSSIDTQFSGSVESATFSNDYALMHSKLTTISLNGTESQPEETNNSHLANSISCEIRKSETGVAVVANADFEATSGVCNSTASNFIDERESHIVAERCDSNTFNHILQEKPKSFLKDNYLDLAYKSTNTEQSLNIDKETTGKHTSTPVKKVTCSSKIPVLQNSPAFGSSKKKGNDVKSNANECHGNCRTECYGLPLCIPSSPVTFTDGSHNLVTMAPGGNIIPQNICGPSYSIHSSTNSLCANYVHVMQSDKISELEKHDFFKKSNPWTSEEVLTSVRRQSSESESSGGFKIEAESNSILCSLSSSTLSDNSSTGNENSLNGTLEEIEMMIQGYEYMCSKNDLNLNPESGVRSNSVPDSVPISEPKQSGRPRGLERCQYIRTSQEEINPSTFHKGFKEEICVATAKTPIVRDYPLKPVSVSCPRPLQRLKKVNNFSNIRSPVGAYINHRPVQLFKTAGKAKPCGRDDISPRVFEQKTVGVCVKQTLLNSAPKLPEIMYEKAPGVNVNPARTERNGPSKKLYATPTVIRHAGRAVLATVPQNAVQILKNAEVSVLYDKDVSKTTTL